MRRSRESVDGCLPAAKVGLTFKSSFSVLNAAERARSVERMTAEAALYSHGPVANSAAAHGKAASTSWRDVKDALDWRKVLIVVGNICATL